MQAFYRLFIALLVFTGIVACEKQVQVGKPIIAFNFNNSLKNTGMATTAIYGPQSVSYAFEKKDTCVDLSLNAASRKALSVKLNDNFSLHDYNGFTISCWVKKHPNDPESYTILSHTKNDSLGWKGWKIQTQANGAWQWSFSDGLEKWHYKPTTKQRINDNNWHQLAFSYNANKQEARLYHNGKNVAIYSLPGIVFKVNNPTIIIGNDSINTDETDLFNGYIDDLMVWARVINDDEIKAIAKQKNNIKIHKHEADETIKVMTWNLWDDGIHDGRYVGIQRIIELIRDANPDLVFLQEADKASISIADELNYLLYKRSDNLCLLSRFPIVNTHNVFNSNVSACIEVALDDKNTLIACPIRLSEEPMLDSYIGSQAAQVDSIYKWEAETRGKESRFLLSELSPFIQMANEKPIIIGGDFNSGSHLDWTEANVSNKLGFAIEFPSSVNFLKKGLHDSFRILYPNETKHPGHTRPLRGDTMLPNRTSFIYYKGNKIIPTQSTVMTNHPNGFPSNQAAVLTTFSWLND
ncbi:endonuclease/exonuclease/phosphatase family protein [Carboxylicivirga sp. A043]|uniref:LamG-like jellyroll fold domain-containing protein n=1 Tax=Carboxylicivirga litoralis TaxID=2816963 RepID=UPI0021CB32B2|nr:LamG-like jellyroll fold domain-containing protein [Carboxylicivirga sp. A043]MCU4154646.1 endonuclease/exonuclease/phosphatase family protein [Carboxylicivirga sp. A043]